MKFETQKKENNPSNKILNSDLIASGDVIDATEILEELPVITTPNVMFDDVISQKISDKIETEISNIVNTEEPQAPVVSKYDNIETIITTTKLPVVEQYTTPSFLEDLFGIYTSNTTQSEDTEAESLKSLPKEISDTGKELPSLFIPLPKTSLSPMFAEDKILQNSNDEFQIATSHKNLHPDKEVTSYGLDIIKNFNDSNYDTNLLSTTITSNEISTITNDANIADETSSILPNTIETSSSSSIEDVNTLLITDSPNTAEINTDDNVSTTTSLLPSITTEQTNSETINEMPQTTASTDSVIVDVINTDFSINNQENNETVSSDQPKPMLELVIQNSEMNDFMSRINNMPIMIRVVNPVVTTTQVPETTTEVSSTELTTSSTLLSVSSNEDTADRSGVLQLETESVLETSTQTENTFSSEQNITTTNTNFDTTLPNSPSTITLQENTPTSNTNEGTEALIYEPNVNDIVIYTTEPQIPVITTAELNNNMNDKMEDLNNSNTKDQNDNDAKTTELPSSDFLQQHSLIRPENTETIDPTILSTSDYQNVIDFANKVVDHVQNYQTQELKQSNEDTSSTFIPIVEDSTINVSEDPLNLISMFIDSDQVHDPEESQKVVNFKSINNRQDTGNPSVQQSKFDPSTQPIIIKNSTVIQYQDITNFKGYNQHQPTKYMDLVPYKDIDYDGQFSAGGDSKFPSDTIYVLDDYDVLPANSNNQHNEYIFVADNGGGNILPANLLGSSADLNNQPVYIIDGNIPNYAARFQQDTATVNDSPQQKINSEFKAPLPRDFQSFRPSRDSDISQNPWYESRQ
ncbi:uncharacterized protein CDAR_295321 [Caerostris darwini]|uniref:Uncharacterized protein n=1 Tax=Caerostris darwini TaxID=1538125 RepID=A0AAV4QV76_9ARAC|nr:uncharacterized protein CDAR_295321 [Caerostris darwini]